VGFPCIKGRYGENGKEKGKERKENIYILIYYFLYYGNRCHTITSGKDSSCTRTIRKYAISG